MLAGFCGVFCSGRQRYYSSGGWKMQWPKLSFLLFFKYFLVRIDCSDASNRSVFALIPKLTQDNQNKMKQQENKGIWPKSQLLGLAWSQHQAGGTIRSQHLGWTWSQH